MSHTPGPWIVRGEHHGLPQVWSENCDTCITDRIFNGNARLIAAAPDLLDACRLLLKAEAMQQGERGGAIMGQISTAIDAARAALEKIPA